MCSNSYCRIVYNCRIAKVSRSKEGGLFRAEGPGGECFEAPKLLISAGGYTYPATGSDGSGFALAAMLGHSIRPPRPALAAVQCTEKDFAALSGIGVEASMTLHRSSERKSFKAEGPLLFTHTGLSGPLIIDNSRYMEAGDTIALNLSGGQTAESFSAGLSAFCASGGKSRLKAFFRGSMLPERLVSAVFSRAGVDPDQRAAELRKTDRNRLAAAFTDLRFTVGSLDGPKKAMCTAGGVDTAELSPSTMESRIISGLYFAGETIDVDGDSGGYNLQFAFSSAMAAAAALSGC